MVARSKSIERVEEKAAKCLMLLSRGEKYGGGERRVFRCKTCLKEFSSFQALGGHCTSHTKPQYSDNDPSVRNKKAKTTTSHTCPICDLEFPMGQALGGHMRRHRNKKDKDFEELITLSLLPETKTTLKNLNSGERGLASLDLDSVESLVNTELELGRNDSLTFHIG